MVQDRSEALRARGELIRDLRISRGLSQEALAHAIGVSVSSVSRWERGLHAGHGARIEELAHALGVPVERFMFAEPADALARLDRIERQVSELHATVLEVLQVSGLADRLLGGEARPPAADSDERSSERATAGPPGA